MSTLHHPHIVLFLGICMLPGSRLPALVMERLLTNLHDLLETQPDIPLGLKQSFLYDVTQGLCYLHSRSPPLIHGNLLARNTLLNSAMTAKINLDLWVARIVSRLGVAARIGAPGASIYMPLADEPRYDTRSTSSRWVWWPFSPSHNASPIMSRHQQVSFILILPFLCLKCVLLLLALLPTSCNQKDKWMCSRSCTGLCTYMCVT